jgi:transposase-like protein
MRKRRTAEQWQEILDRQKESGQRDAEAARAAGVSVASLRGWRQRLRNRRDGSQPLVEVSGLRSVGELRVHLPNGLVVEVSSGWAADQLAAVVARLRAL